MEAATIKIAIEASAAGLTSGLAAAGSSIKSFAQTAQTSLANLGKAASGLAIGGKIVSKAGLASSLASVVGFSDGSVKKLKGFERQLGSTAGTIKKFGLAFAGLAGLALGLAAVIGPAIKFESAFAGVKKTIDGTPKQLAAIREGLIGMSQVMPTSASDLASIAENAGQLGVKAPDVLKFTETIAKLGETTNLSFDEAAQSLAKFLNITGSGAAGVDKIADIIVKLGNNAATTEADIVSFATRLASAFTAAGATEAEILSAASSFSSLGVEAEAGGSALSRAITEIADAAILGGDNLDVFAKTAGLIPEEFAAIAEATPYEAFILFEEGLGRVIESGESITPILDELGLSGLRVRRSLELGAIGSGLLREQLDLANNAVIEGTAANEEYGKRIETTASRLEIFSNRVQGLLISLGTPLLATFATAVDAVGDALVRMSEIFGPAAGEVAKSLGTIAGSFGKLLGLLGSPVIKATALAFEGLATIIGGFFGLLNSSKPVLLGVTVALVAFKIQAIAAAVSTSYLGTALGFVALKAGGAIAGMLGITTASSAATIALGALPIVAVAAGLIAIGKAFRDANAAADEAADVFRDEFADALEAADFDKFNKGVDDLQTRIDELNAEQDFGGGIVGGIKKMDTAIVGLKQVLTPFTENTVLNARQELKALNEEFENSGAEPLTEGITALSTALGISEQDVLAMGTELGILDLIAESGSFSFHDLANGGTEVSRALQEMNDEIAPLGDALGLSIQQILKGEATLQDFETATDLAGGTLEYLARQIDGVDFEDFQEGADPDKMLAAYYAVEQLADGFADAAAAIGLTSDELAIQLGHADALVASHDKLRTAVSGAQTAMEAFRAQQELTAAATVAFNTAFGAIAKDDDNSLRDAIRSMNTLGLETAASGVGAEAAVDNYASLYASLKAGALEAGYTEEAFNALVTEIGLVPESKITEVAWLGEDAYEDVQDFQKLVGETQEEFEFRILVDSLPAQDQIVITELLAMNFADGSYRGVLGVEDEATPVVDDATTAVEDFDRAEGSAELDVTDFASADIANVRRALDALKDKTITVTTKTRGGSGTYFANGGISYYANGGVENHVAQIAPAGAMRIWAEPETGGEAYIPLASSKRQRSLGILNQTAGIMGQKVVPMAQGGILSFAEGGITTSSFSNGAGQLPTIVVDVAIDATAIGELDVKLTPVQLAANKVAAGFDKASIAAAVFGIDAERAAARAAAGFDDPVAAAAEMAAGMDKASIKAAAGFDAISLAAGRVAIESAKEFGGLELTVEQTGEAMLRALRPSEFLDTFSRISGWASDSFEDWLVDWDGTTDDAVNQLEAAGLEMGHIFRGIAGEGALIGVDMVDAFQDAGIDMIGIAEDVGRDMILALDSSQFLDEFSRISGWGKDAFVDWLAAADENSAKVVEEMREAGTDINTIFAELFNADESIAAIEGAGLEMEHIFEQLFREGATDAEILDFAIQDLADSMGDVEQATRRAADVFDLLTGSKRDVIDAELDYLDAVERVNDVINEERENTSREDVLKAELDYLKQIETVQKNIYGEEIKDEEGNVTGTTPGTFGRDNSADIANLESLIAAGEAMRDYGEAIATSGVSAGEAVTQYADLRTGFEDLAVSTGLPRDEIEALIGAIFDSNEEISALATGTENLFGTVTGDARDNYEALLRAGDQMREYGLAVAGSGVSADYARELFDGLREEFTKMATDANLSDLEVEELVNTLLGVPDSVITELAVEGAEAGADVSRFEDALAAIDAATIVPTFDADTGLLDEATLKVLDDLGIIAEATPTPSADVDMTHFDIAITRANELIDLLDGQIATTITRNTIETTQTNTVSNVGTYTVASGDSWWAIASKVWGDPTRYAELAEKNNKNPSAVIHPGMIVNYAEGGYDAPNNHRAEMAPAGAMRLWAEPETGGEAYIPLANDHRRGGAIGVLELAARHMGFGLTRYANGGMTLPSGGMNFRPSMSNSTTNNSPMTVNVHASAGMNEQMLAREVGTQIRSAMKDQARDLANLRR